MERNNQVVLVDIVVEVLVVVDAKQFCLRMRLHRLKATVEITSAAK